MKINLPATIPALPLEADIRAYLQSILDVEVLRERMEAAKTAHLNALEKHDASGYDLAQRMKREIGFDAVVIGSEVVSIEHRMMSERAVVVVRRVRELRTS